MKIKTIEFENFRNIQSMRLCFDDGVWLIAGENAQGKTNILEGIYLASSMRSFRSSQENQLIYYGQKQASVKLCFEENEREHEIEIILHAAEKKKVFSDGRRIQKNRDALGFFQSVLFTPDHLMMIKGSPTYRREFLDIAICAVSAKYTEYLLQYNKALKNRNRVLKEAAENSVLADTLPVWEEMLCKFGSFIAFCRQQYVMKLNETAKEIYDQISGGKEKIKLLYLNQFSKDALSEAEYFSKIKERLEKTRASDIEKGMTCAGVHKDDILMLIAGKSAKFFASQGQIRSLTLSLKLAEAKISERETGKKPVLLLDDIFSELDESRQKFIMEQTFDNQCIVTTCEPDKLKNISYNMIFIENGGQKCIST